MKRALITLFAISVVLMGCDYTSPYSGYPVNFVFDSTIHPYNQATSPGQFISVRQGTNAGQYTLTDAQGNTQTVNIPQIYLRQSKFYYGLGGLIIGTPMNTEARMWAFDWACPNCDKAGCRVDIERTTGLATCPECGVKFDLNSGGIAIEGKSRPMWQYRIIGSDDSRIVHN